MGIIVLVLVSLLISQFPTSIDAQKFIQDRTVSYGFNYTRGSVFEDNLKLVYKHLTSKSSLLKFYNVTVGDRTNQVYGLYQCRYDLGLDVCSACVKAASEEMSKLCPLSGECMVWYLECMLRYANRNILSTYDTNPGAYDSLNVTVSNPKEFTPILLKTMNSIIKNATYSTPYYASGMTPRTPSKTLYSFAQCTPNIKRLECNSCLQQALSLLNECCSKRVSVKAFLPSCQLWYDLSPFLADQFSKYILNNTSFEPYALTHRWLYPYESESERNKGKSVFNVTIIVLLIASGLVGLILTIICWRCRKQSTTTNVRRSTLPLRSPRGIHDDTGTIDPESFGNTEFVQYDFNTLRVITKNFSAENKLGEGGFGIVYKGTLENRELVAIKRLSGGASGQGTKEFKTEANLLAKLQHKNLVRLVGFCIKGDEKLLVYEFMSNGSLDMFLFDASRRVLFDWMMRYKIIMGIARGLQYLHEDSRLTIVHRDLKPGNILLDNEMNPKIADFGLAKLFGGAQKQGNTVRIVGTLGYMAPEYLSTGDYSDKSDVYSFGIMLLEIICGQRNTISKPPSQKEELPVLAWRLWNEKRPLAITDPILYNKCPSSEVIRCIQIALLCVQAIDEQRPTMTSVVLMLTGSVDLPLPSAPTMPSYQYSMPLTFNSELQSEPGHSTNSLTMNSDVVQDLYPRPR